MLPDILQERRDSLVAGWIESVRATYPSAGRIKFSQRPREFNDPIGHILHRDLPVLFELIVTNEFDTPALAEHLDPICRLRSVQEFSASEAVGFVYSLKKVLREALDEGELNDPVVLRELLVFESRVDRLAMHAFDLYHSCREELYELKTREAKRRSDLIVQRYASKGKAAFDKSVDKPDSASSPVTNGHEGGKA